MKKLFKLQLSEFDLVSYDLWFRTRFGNFMTAFFDIVSLMIKIIEVINGSVKFK